MGLPRAVTSAFCRVRSGGAACSPRFSQYRRRLSPRGRRARCFEAERPQRVGSASFAPLLPIAKHRHTDPRPGRDLPTLERVGVRVVGERPAEARRGGLDLRLCLAQQRVLDNADDVTGGGYDRGEVAAALAQEEPQHELWHHVHSPDRWGIGEQTRLVAPEVELLYVHDTSDLDGGQWQPGEERLVLPLLMRWDGGRSALSERLSCSGADRLVLNDRQAHPRRAHVVLNPAPGLVHLVHLDAGDAQRTGVPAPRGTGSPSPPTFSTRQFAPLNCPAWWSPTGIWSSSGTPSGTSMSNTRTCTAAPRGAVASGGMTTQDAPDDLPAPDGVSVPHGDPAAPDGGSATPGGGPAAPEGDPTPDGASVTGGGEPA